MKTITVDKLKSIAKNLIDDGTNVEYVRGICELIADVDGVSEVEHAERSIQIAEQLGLSKYAANNLYPNDNKIIGYQICDKNGRIPDEFYSFEILTEAVANFWMEHYNDGTYHIKEIQEGFIEKPKLVEYL